MKSILTKEEILEILQRTTPADYHYNLLNSPGSGGDIYRAQAAVLSRVSEKLHDTFLSLFPDYASGSALATGKIKISRPTVAEGAYVINAIRFGLTVKCTEQEEPLRENVYEIVAFTNDDSVFVDAVPPDDLNVVVPVTAVTTGTEHNLPIDIRIEILDIETNPPGRGGDLSATIHEATTGGKHATLDGLGREINTPRSYNESDTDYVKRMFELPDNISPAAVRRVLERYFNPFGVQAFLIEPQDYGFACDLDSCDAICNDRIQPCFDICTYRAAIIVKLPQVENLGFCFGGCDTDWMAACDVMCCDAANVTRRAFYTVIEHEIRKLLLGGVICHFVYGDYPGGLLFQLGIMQINIVI